MSETRPEKSFAIRLTSIHQSASAVDKGKIMEWSLGACFGYPDSVGRRRLDRLFADRKVLDDDAFYEAHFPSHNVRREVVKGVRYAFLEILMFNMDRLNMDDDFSKKLGFIWHYDSLADAEIITRIEHEFDVTLSEAEAVCAVTLRDLVELVDSKITERMTARPGARENPDDAQRLR